MDPRIVIVLLGALALPVGAQDSADDAGGSESGPGASNEGRSLDAGLERDFSVMGSDWDGDFGFRAAAGLEAGPGSDRDSGEFSVMGDDWDGSFGFDNSASQGAGRSPRPPENVLTRAQLERLQHGTISAIPPGTLAVPYRITWRGQAINQGHAHVLAKNWAKQLGHTPLGARTVTGVHLVGPGGDSAAEFLIEVTTTDTELVYPSDPRHPAARARSEPRETTVERGISRLAAEPSPTRKYVGDRPKIE